MSTDKNISTIKKICAAIVPDANVYLFGSRAKGLARVDSDYDVLIELQNESLKNQKLKIGSLIRKKAADFFIDLDIVIKTKSEVELYRNWSGHIVKYALLESQKL